MSIVDDSIRLLVFLLPGFVAMKVVAHKCDVKQQSQHETLIDALLYSVVVGKNLACKPSWLYLPPGTEIEYVRAEEGAERGQQ